MYRQMKMKQPLHIVFVGSIETSGCKNCRCWGKAIVLDLVCYQIRVCLLIACIHLLSSSDIMSSLLSQRARHTIWYIRFCAHWQAPQTSWSPFVDANFGCLQASAKPLHQLPACLGKSCQIRMLMLGIALLRSLSRRRLPRPWYWHRRCFPWNLQLNETDLDLASRCEAQAALPDQSQKCDVW